MKKTLLTILISGIIFTSIGATAAYVYTARDINYQPSDENWEVSNVQEAISELKTDVNNINNKVEGIERVYKAGEVELVALVSDDSFYKDSNDKYVLSNSDTGRTLLADTSTYKSLASTSDCVGIVGADTCSPFNGGGVKETASAVVYSANSISYYVYQIINEKDDTIQSYAHAQNTAGQLEGEYIKINRYTSNPALVFKAKKSGKYRVYKLDASFGSGSYTFIEEKTCNVDDTIVSQNTWGWGGSAKPQFIVKAI